MCLQYHRLKVYEDNNNRIKVGYKIFHKWSDNTYTNIYYDTRKKYVLGDWNSIDNIEQKSVITVSPCYSKKDDKYYTAGFHFYTDKSYALRELKYSILGKVVVECICSNITAKGYQFADGLKLPVKSFVAQEYRLMREVKKNEIDMG